MEGKVSSRDKIQNKSKGDGSLKNKVLGKEESDLQIKVNLQLGLLGLVEINEIMISLGLSLKRIRNRLKLT